MVNNMFLDFQYTYEREMWSLCTVTFGQKVLKLNSRPVYCSRLCGSLQTIILGFRGNKECMHKLLHKYARRPESELQIKQKTNKQLP